MKTTCEDFDRIADPGADVDSDERRRWQRHLEQCTRCRRQAEADRMLRTAMGSPPSLTFSAGFDGALRQQLEERRRPRPASPAARFFLAGYASAAAALSIWILGGIDWQSAPSPGGAGILLVLAVLATPLLLLPQSPFLPPGPE